MYLIRSIVVAQSGRRDELARLMKEFTGDFSKELGKSHRVLTGSVGPSDMTVVSESEVESLAAFEQGLATVNSSDKMAKYGPKFGELSVPGTHRFEIYRIMK
jgi:hypothetical protein